MPSQRQSSRQDRRRGRLGLFWLGLLGLLGCGQTPSLIELPQRASAEQISYSQVWQLASHNSYWAERRGGDPWASGVNERLLDQLLADGARTLELDIHPSEVAHEFRVYHLQPGDSQCDSLRECLGIVRLFQRALPQHRPLLVQLELKHLFAALWDGEHTPEDLDRVLRQELGAALYTPGEFLAPCLPHGIASLRECMRQTGWPAVNDLAGRVLVAPMGYWHMFGGQNDVAWVDYSRSRPAVELTAFPLAINTRYTTLSPDGQQQISEAQFDEAMAQAVFWYSEDVNDPLTQAFVREGGIVMYGEATATARQLVGIANGLQLLQTDTPWIAPDTEGRIQPLRSLDPGQRRQAIGEVDDAVQLRSGSGSGTGSTGEVARLLQVAPGQPSRWEATLISGHESELSACLTARSQPRDAATLLSLCRWLVPNHSGPDSLRLRLRLRLCQAGRCTEEDFLSNDGEDGGPGEHVVLELASRGSQTCLTARAARLASLGSDGRTGSARLATLASDRCVDGALPYQGIARVYDASDGSRDAGRPVSFFGLRHDEQPLSVGDLPIDPTDGAP